MKLEGFAAKTGRIRRQNWKDSPPKLEGFAAKTGRIRRQNWKDSPPKPKDSPPLDFVSLCFP
ncbi:MAG: hypothetical protein ACOX8U_06520 [Bradymonadia bacterium]